jgi:hypothetical protein
MNRDFPFALKPRWEVLAAGMLLCTAVGAHADEAAPQAESAAAMPAASSAPADPTPTNSPPPVPAANATGSGPQVVPVTTQPTQPAASSSAETATKPTIDKFSDVVGTFAPQGVLTPKGSFVIDPSFQFSTSSSNRVSLVGYTIIPAITIGLININKVTRNSYVFALDGRYGLTDRLEVSAHVPYVYQKESTSVNPLATPSNGPENFIADGAGIGDVQLGLRYQFNQPDPGMPYYVGSLRVNAPTGTGPFDVPYSEVTGLQTKTPTGSGFWGVQPGVAWVLPTDPAVLYGGISYQYNFQRNINKTLFIQSSSGAASSEYIGDVKPGNVFEFNFGMGFGINDKASFSIGYDHNVVGITKVNGEKPAGALSVQIGELLIGYSYRISPKQTVNLTLGVGTTPDSPNVQITLHAPFDF